MKKTLVWTVDESIYAKEAVFSACYRYIDRAWLRIRRTAPGRLRVEARPKPGAEAGALAEMENGFENELVHQSLRLRALERGGRLREGIVLRALVSAAGAPGADGSREAAPAADARIEAEIDEMLEKVRAGDGEDPLGILEEWRDGENEPDARSRDLPPSGG